MRGHTVIVLQKPTEPDCALHIAKCRLGLNRWRFTGESPVRPLVVIALHIRSREVIEVLFAEDQKVVDAFD
jgi:hypothetical protein